MIKNNKDDKLSKRVHLIAVCLPHSFLEWLGAILSAFSIVALLNYGFSYGLSNTLLILIEYYDNLLNILFGWAEAPLNYLLLQIGKLFEISIRLGPSWKHIAVLIGLYFFRNVARIIAQGGLYAGAYQFFIALLLSIAVSAGASSIDISNPSYWSQFTIGFFPILGR